MIKILTDNYQEPSHLTNLNEAIRILEQILDTRGSYIRSKALNNLVPMLGWRFEQTGSIDDLNRAIDVAGQASWFGELITKIRAQPGFNNYLLPPTADELMAAANPGPMIAVNLSSHRRDAFLIERNRIRVLKLPNLTLEEVQKRAHDPQSSRITGSIAPLLE